MTAIAATASTSTTSSSSYSGMTTDDFIQIMLTELQNQDPTEPTKTADMVESMREVQDLLRTQQEGLRADLAWASGMVGSTVTVSQSLLGSSELASLVELGLDPDVGASTATGTVSDYRIVDGSVWITVGGHDYPIADVTALDTAEDAAEDLVGLAAGLQGRTVSYLTDDGGTASGTVQSVSLADDGSYTMDVAGTTVALSRLLSVS